MAKPLAVDWNYAFLLFSQGLSHKEIAAQLGASLGAVKQQSSRKKWTHQVTTARESITTAVTKTVQAGALTIQKRAENWIDVTASDVERTVETLAKLKLPKSLRGLKQHEEVWGLHVKRGRTTFGLDQQSANIQVNIGLSGVADLLPSADPAPPIDIDPSGIQTGIQ